MSSELQILHKVGGFVQWNSI